MKKKEKIIRKIGKRRQKRKKVGKVRIIAK